MFVGMGPPTVSRTAWDAMSQIGCENCVWRPPGANVSSSLVWLRSRTDASSTHVHVLSNIPPTRHEQSVSPPRYRLQWKGPHHSVWKPLSGAGNSGFVAPVLNPPDACATSHKLV